MWLIDTTTLKLEQVVDPSQRKFAILSHTWDDEGEVTFQDMQNLDIARTKPGFRKIESTCHIASLHFRYVWIDTCCIDKSSSAELSEAINSMFYWYQCSKLCYVFLSDFEPLPERLREHERKALVDLRLSKCRWFTRGWTLQELIAPTHLEFFDYNWTFIGGKPDLEATLTRITNVDGSILNGSTRLSSIPVARRMSWAARRKTTRVEDMAYCLLGIFDINMPLLYGEGTKAFYRLQLQLASENNDLSMFAWQKDGESKQGAAPEFGGIFAESPDDFKICSTLKRHHELFFVENQFTITNTGLRMDAILHPCPDDDPHGDYLLGLDCVERIGRETLWLAIYLKKVGNTYVRARPDMVATAMARSDWASGSVRSTINIKTRLLADDIQRIKSSIRTGIVITYGHGLSHVVTSREGKPKNCTQEQDGHFIFHVKGKDNFLGLHTISIQSGPSEKDIDDIVLVCCLQWNGACCQLIFGLYSGAYSMEKGVPVFETMQPSARTRNYAKLITELSSPKANRAEHECLNEVKDMMMTRHSDLSGALMQETIPSQVNVIETVSFGKKSSKYSRALSVRLLENSEIEKVFGSKPRRNYFHAVIECAPAFLSNNQPPTPPASGLSAISRQTMHLPHRKS